MKLWIKMDVFYFKKLPLDIQLEILKYNPNYILLNKLYYTKGYHLYKELYMNAPITMNEFINYYMKTKKRYYTIYCHEDFDICIYILVKLDKHVITRYNVNIDDRLYYTHISKLNKIDHEILDNDTLSSKLLKFKNYQFDTPLIFDILLSRGNIVTKKYISNYIDNIWIIPYQNNINIILNKIIEYIYLSFQIGHENPIYINIPIDLQLKNINIDKYHDMIQKYTITNDIFREEVKRQLGLLFISESRNMLYNLYIFSALSTG